MVGFKLRNKLLVVFYKKKKYSNLSLAQLSLIRNYSVPLKHMFRAH